MQPRTILRLMYLCGVVAAAAVVYLGLSYHRLTSRQAVLRQSEPYRLAVHLARQDEGVKAVLGADWKALAPHGTVREQDDVGEASLYIPVSGSAETKGQLIADMARRGQSWAVQALSLEMPNGLTLAITADNASLATDVVPTGPEPSHATPTAADNAPKIVWMEFARSAKSPELIDPRFKPGDEVYFRVVVQSLQLDAHREASFAEDLRVLGPDNEVILEQTDVVNTTVALAGADGTATITNNIPLEPGAKSGFYTVKVTVRDLISGLQVSDEKDFRVR